ncbi:hypothetical protein [Helicobacter fennelliae]|uniref:Uncharacterized protein n=1 Tax=Helicobacter fennelliae MRY12-0050 TaxID=1325130 RepID=T1DXB8_9HELI|nr:hypothetical protein [Helicobacter fennelliae]GAD20127.1 hypothetical protein HFN_1371 [Helicobacter fennelliae MRY12-0050]STP08112.1 Uncharacterised protein [Helicobacter fennelliae]STQ83980.1 Uncharacterised protein [Helicobacter fennelliae]
MSVTLEISQDIQDIYTQLAQEQDISKESLMQMALAEYAHDLAIALQGRSEYDKAQDWDTLKAELRL